MQGLPPSLGFHQSLYTSPEDPKSMLPLSILVAHMSHPYGFVDSMLTLADGQFVVAFQNQTTKFYAILKNHILFFLFHEYLVGQFQANKGKEMLHIGIVALTC